MTQRSRKKIRVAFVKYGGLVDGGTEKVLHTIAANLPKDRFAVDFYACDPAPYIGADVKQGRTNPKNIAFLRKHGVKVITFKVGAKDLRTVTHVWRDTNFFELFDEKNYDIIQTGRAGHPEFPFTKIRKTPIVDTLHLSSMPDNQPNVSRVVHICQWNARAWIRRGGDADRVRVISYPISIDAKGKADLRAKLGLKGKFIYGFHQRADDGIFSPIPLAAYAKIETEKTAFIVLNSSKRYAEQAKQLGLKNFIQLPRAETMENVYAFLRTLDVYAHGRKDGEINSQAIAEAMYFGKPVVSHYTRLNNGQVETIGDAGIVVRTAEQYAEELARLRDDRALWIRRSRNARRQFAANYDCAGQTAKFAALYEEVVQDPAPHPFRRKIYYGVTFVYLVVKWAVAIARRPFVKRKTS